MTHPYRGFTFIEMIIVITLSAIVVAAATSILGGTFRSHQLQEEMQALDSETHLAISRMEREIRSISSTASDGLLKTIPNSEITFMLSGQTVSYKLQGKTLLRNGIPIADNITNLEFSYQDTNFDTISPATNQADIRHVTIKITFQLNQTELSLNTTVAPRNFV